MIIGLQDFLFHMIGGVLILVTSIILVSGTYPGSCGVMEKTSAAVSVPRKISPQTISHATLNMHCVNEIIIWEIKNAW